MSKQLVKIVHFLYSLSILYSISIFNAFILLCTKNICIYYQIFVEVLTRAVLCILCPTNFYLHKPQRNNNINLIHYSNLRLCVLKQTHTRKKSFSSNFQNPKFSITVCCCSVTKWSESSIVEAWKMHF